MGFLRLICWPLMFLLGAGCALGQTWGHEVWSTENGLPQNSVHAVSQTRDGYVWVATEGGLARFNGAGFTVFRRENTPVLTSDDLCCLAEDATGALLVGSADDWVKFDRGVFSRVSGVVAAPEPVIWTGGGLPEGRVQTTFRDSRGRVWVGTGSFHIPP